MPDQRYGQGWGWGGGNWGDRRPGRPMRRPPWWPSNEAWPPEGAAGWQELLRCFLRRAGCFFVFMAILFVLAIVAVAWVLSAVIGSAIGAAIGVIVALLAIVIGARLVFGGFRSAAMPMSDLIEAAGRVE